MVKRRFVGLGLALALGAGTAGQSSLIPPNLATVVDMECQAHSDANGNWRSHVVVSYVNPEHYNNGHPWELDIASGKKHNYKDGRKAAERACNDWLDRVDKLLPVKVKEKP